ncbi:HD-GYP domain-containing protein [Deinococcus hohokamensis]|uniref:HD-GYP domain-containing protein n=1 Tax=Deinococcus hohokamensis TaxID=309883 RepID=A0ABV9I7K3_9DEIO
MRRLPSHRTAPQGQTAASIAAQLGLPEAQVRLIEQAALLHDVGKIGVSDALTSQRPYKPAWSVEAAVAELRAQAGRHFDPRVVAALERYLARQETIVVTG